MKTLFFTSLLCTLLLILSSEVSAQTYTNFKQKQVYLPDSLFPVKEKFIFKNATLLDKKAMENAAGDKNAITGYLYDQLLELDFINGWKRDSITQAEFGYPKKEKRQFIDEQKEVTTLYNLGSITLSGNYQSLLVLKKIYFDYYFFALGLILLNIENNLLKSITTIGYLFYSNGYCSLGYSKILKNGQFLYKYKPISSDVIYANKKDEKRYGPKEEAISRFTFDKEGYVKILWENKNRDE